MSRKRTWVATSIFCSVVLAQQTAPTPPVAEEPKPPAPTVYKNDGKPIKLDFSCKEDDINAFGLTCSTDDPCEVYLELAAIEPVGSKMFATGNLHTSSVTLWSVLLVSEDGGKTWTEGHERARSTGFEHIQFIDFESGWVSGQTLLSLPRDPFLLLTNDGGKTWRKKPIRSETHVGAVQHFSFETAKDGQLLIDRTQTGDSGGRYEFYESNSGGDSWSLRQVSPKPVALKRPRQPNPDWRIRADARSKSFVIERRTNERWQGLSSFLVKVGECQPEEFKLAEPPPTEEEKKATTAEELGAASVIIVPSGKKASAPKKKK
jgi:hypothetical protein